MLKARGLHTSESEEVYLMRKLSRQEAIDEIRRELLKLVDEEHSICEVAASRGIYCFGFSHYSDDELFERLDWLAEKKHITSRQELEKAAGRWQLARQRATDKPLACDVQKEDHDICNGWDEHSNAQLERFHMDLCGEYVQIVGEEPRPRARAAF